MARSGNWQTELMNLAALISHAMSEQEKNFLVGTARRLVQRLRDISEASVAAGWLNDLEYMVWQDIVNRRLVANLLVSPEGDVFPPLEEAEKHELRGLSEAIGGWVVYDGSDVEDEAAFVPLPEWSTRFEAWFDRAKAAVAATQ
jgi:hypothetical protein